MTARKGAAPRAGGTSASPRKQSAAPLCSAVIHDRSRPALATPSAHGPSTNFNAMGSISSWLRPTPSSDTPWPRSNVGTATKAKPGASPWLA